MNVYEKNKHNNNASFLIKHKKMYAFMDLTRDYKKNANMNNPG